MCTPRVAITAVPPSLAPCPGGGHAGAWPLPASFRRRLVLAGLLGLVGLLLGLVHRALGVLRRAVDGVEDQRVLAGVDEVVLLAGRDDDQVALGDLLGRAGDARLAGAADEGEDLVGVLVRLLTDLTARRDRHDDELGVLAGPEDATEVGALLGLGGDRVMDDGRHGRRSSRRVRNCHPAPTAIGPGWVVPCSLPCRTASSRPRTGRLITRSVD